MFKNAKQIFYFVYTQTRNKILFLQIVLHIRKLGTAINQTPISSIGRKDPLPICMHVAYECKWAL